VNAGEIAEMRDWITDCTWRDLTPDEAEALSDAEVIEGIAATYPGGVDGFLAASGSDR